MAEYIIDKSTNEKYEYVVWRMSSTGNGSCSKSVFHSNDESECKKFISKQRRKDSYRAKKLLKQQESISEKRRVLQEEYNERMQYVKGYRKDTEVIYD
jgi:hypothetical protein